MAPTGSGPGRARRGSALARGLAVHAYFNNTMGGDAVRDAARLEEMLGSPAGGELLVEPIARAADVSVHHASRLVVAGSLR